MKNRESKFFSLCRLACVQVQSSPLVMMKV